MGNAQSRGKGALSQGKYDRGLKVAKAALQVAERDVGPNRPSLATSLENLAGLYRVTNRSREAEEVEACAKRIRAVIRRE